MFSSRNEGLSWRQAGPDRSVCGILLLWMAVKSVPEAPTVIDIIKGIWRWVTCLLARWQLCCIYVCVPLSGLAAPFFLLAGGAIWVTAKPDASLGYESSHLSKWWLFDRHVSCSKRVFFFLFFMLLQFALNTSPTSHRLEQMQDYTCACFVHQCTYEQRWMQTVKCAAVTGCGKSLMKSPKYWIKGKKIKIEFTTHNMSRTAAMGALIIRCFLCRELPEATGYIMRVCVCLWFKWKEKTAVTQIMFHLIPPK